MIQSNSVLSTPPTNTPAESTSTRRIFLAQAASTAVIAATVAPAASMTTDPIFAAIEAHRDAMAGSKFINDLHSELDRKLPVERRRSRITPWEEEIVSTDDPRWIGCTRALMTAFDRETNAAIELLTVRPTTAAGVLA